MPEINTLAKALPEKGLLTMALLMVKSMSPIPRKKQVWQAKQGP